MTAARRAPSIGKLVRAQRAGREPPPGALICAYETSSEVGQITIVVPPPGERGGASYRATRDAYFDRYPGSWRRVAGLGEDAWLAGGAALRVLASEDLSFAVATQFAADRSEHLLTAVARAVLARLDARSAR